MSHLFEPCVKCICETGGAGKVVLIVARTRIRGLLLVRDCRIQILVPSDAGKAREKATGEVVKVVEARDIFGGIEREELLVEVLGFFVAPRVHFQVPTLTMVVGETTKEEGALGGG